MHIPLFTKEDSYEFKVPGADTFTIATNFKATNDTLEKASQKTALDFNGFDDLHNFEKFYLLENATTSDLLNLSYTLLEDTLWPSLQPPNWQTDAARLLAQPEYIVMLTLCLLALITNILSIIAVFNIQQKLTTHLKLIVSLGLADIFIVISVLLHIVNRIFNSPMSYFGVNTPSDRLACACIAAIINSINIFAFLVSLLNLQVMAIDHFIGILHPWCYRRHFLSKTKVYIIIAVIWIISAFGGFSNFLFGYASYENKEMFFNYCEYIMYDNFHAEYLVFGVTMLAVLVMFFIYIRIYFEVKRIQTRTPSFPDETTQNKKIMYTSFFIMASFCVCWLPNCIYQIIMILKIHYDNSDFHHLFGTYLLISKYLYILILVNCLFDPIIYAIRLTIVRNGYKNFAKKLAQRFHSIRKNSCKGKCCYKRQTGNSEYELSRLRRPRPSAQPLIDTKSQDDTNENSKSFNSDVNENEYLVVTNSPSEGRNEQNCTTHQESTNCFQEGFHGDFHGSHNEIIYVQLHEYGNHSIGNQNEHINIKVDDTANASQRSNGNPANKQEPTDNSVASKENHKHVQFKESTNCSCRSQDKLENVKFQEYMNCSPKSEKEYNHVKLENSEVSSQGSQDELSFMTLLESVV